MPPDRRRWISHLAAPVPPGPDGQPGHEAGAEVVVIMPVLVPDFGVVSLSVPRPSALLLGAAEPHIRRAKKLRSKLPSQVRRGEWVQPGLEFHFTNEQLPFDYFQDAMAAVVLLHSALDNFLIECLPENATWRQPDGSELNRSQLEALGIENRLSRVLAAVLGRPNLRTAEPVVWATLMALKDLRDSIGHARLDRSYVQHADDDPAATIFSALLAADLKAFEEAVEYAMTHYGGSPR